jgi:hypothetical protein
MSGIDGAMGAPPPLLDDEAGALAELVSGRWARSCGKPGFPSSDDTAN